MESRRLIFLKGKESTVGFHTILVVIIWGLKIHVIE